MKAFSLWGLPASLLLFCCFFLQHKISRIRFESTESESAWSCRGAGRWEEGFLRTDTVDPFTFFLTGDEPLALEVTVLYSTGKTSKVSDIVPEPLSNGKFLYKIEKIHALEEEHVSLIGDVGGEEKFNILMKRTEKITSMPLVYYYFSGV